MNKVAHSYNNSEDEAEKVEKSQDFRLNFGPQSPNQKRKIKALNFSKQFSSVNQSVRVENATFSSTQANSFLPTVHNNNWE